MFILALCLSAISLLDRDILEIVSIILSLGCTLYAIILKAFFAAWYDFDDSAFVTVSDCLPLVFCLVGCLYGIKSHHQSSQGFGTLGGYILSCYSLFLAQRLYVKQVVGKKFKEIEVSGRVYIVTGSNTGLGFETTKELVRMGAIVIMACRSLEKAKIAREAILNEVNCDPSQMIVLPLDLNSFSSVRSFASEFEKLKRPLHCLINNAGLMMSERSVTPEGFEMVMTANHFSAFLLTSLLIPALEAGAKKFKVYSRVVNVSSSLHQIPKKFNFDDIMSEKRFELFYTYGQSKLANILFTLELQRRLVKSGSHITANCLHPGFVRTEVTRHMNAFLYWGDKLATPFMLTLQKTPPQGAYCTLHVATSPELEQKGGLYFINCDAARPSAAATDIDARQLWEVSNTQTKATWSGKL